jgi:ABC-type polysaccharide/polyol phosphate export permease
VPRLLKNLKELYRYRVLIQNLVVRELKARYRGTVLGFLWSFFNPLLLMIVYTAVFGLILNPRDPTFERNPLVYALYLFCGILPWHWFASSTLESANVLMINGNLIKKILFPAEVLPVVTVTSNMVHFFFGLPILLLFILLMGRPPRLRPAPAVVIFVSTFSRSAEPSDLVLDRSFPGHQDILSTG